MGLTRLTRLSLIVTILVVGSIAAYVGYSGLIQPTPQKIETVVYIQNWVPAGIYAPLWYGVQSGLFLQHGMQVTLAGSTGSGDAVSKLDLGLGQFGQSDAATWLKATLGGSKTKAIGMYTIKNEAVIIYNKDRIKSPKDIEGKTLASTSPNEAAEAQFPAFAGAVGIDHNKISILRANPTLRQQLLAEGKVDAIFATLPTIPTATRLAKEKAMEVGVFSYNEYGVKIFSNLILARENVIKENPDLVRRFLKGFYKAYRYSIANPEQTVRIITDLNPGLSYENELDKMKDLIKWNNPVTLFQTKPIAKIDDQLMKETVLNAARQLKLQLPSDDYYKSLYTNEFLPNTLD